MNTCIQPLFRVRRPTLAILAPHPDDDILGCGLLIGAARRAGWRIVVVALTDGQLSHPGSLRWPPRALGQLRRGEMRRALARLGAGTLPLRFMGWRDGSLVQCGSALRLRRLLQSFGVTDVAVASPRDHHPDHRAAWRLARAATANCRLRLHVYEVWARSEGPRRRHFAPGKAAKQWAMQAHRSQVSPYISDDPAGFVFAKSTLHHLVSAAETLTLRHNRIAPTARPTAAAGQLFAASTTAARSSAIPNPVSAEVASTSG